MAYADNGLYVSGLLTGTANVAGLTATSEGDFGNTWVARVDASGTGEWIRMISSSAWVDGD